MFAGRHLCVPETKVAGWKSNFSNAVVTCSGFQRWVGAPVGDHQVAQGGLVKIGGKMNETNVVVLFFHLP